MRVSLVLLFLLPLIEIAGFVLVGRQIGVLPTLGLIIAAGFVGAALLRHQGFGIMNRIRSEVQAGRDPSRDLAHGVMVLAAGVLLLIPGFFTDIVGILLFLPPIRDLGWRFLRRRINFSADFTTMGGFSRPYGDRSNTIDLDAEEYSEEKVKPAPSHQIRDK